MSPKHNIIASDSFTEITVRRSIFAGQEAFIVYFHGVSEKDISVISLEEQAPSESSSD